MNCFAYNENRARLEPDLQHLKNQRLISDRQIEVQDGSHSRVRSLTKEGKRWRDGQAHFDQVRKEYETIRIPQTVTFTFSPVNGQIALFERHPNSLVKSPWKSKSKPLFPGDFIPSVTQAER